MRVIGVMVVVGTLLVAAFLVGTGLWALISPDTFYTQIAPYPPFSRHLVHDIGAFELGLGACLVFGLLVRDALLAVLAGNAVGATAHFVSHLMDHSIGGHPSDPLTIGLLALVTWVLVFGRLVHQRARSGARSGRLVHQRPSPGRG
jgi:uncharacterized membrane protein